jgi:hypothetical protein
MLTHITNFLITEWIWSFTGGLSHLPINFLLLFMLLKLWDHMSWLRAFLMSFLLTVGAFIIFFGVINLVIVWGLKIPFKLPEDTYAGAYNVLNTSLILAAIYSAIQMIGVAIAQHWAHFNLWRAYLCILCANVMSALLVYKITFNM